MCKQSRWAEVEFVTSTSARAVIPKMDKTFASLGIPVSVSSDNGPPFNSQDFSDFSKSQASKQKILKYDAFPQCKYI